MFPTTWGRLTRSQIIAVESLRQFLQAEAELRGRAVTTFEVKAPESEEFRPTVTVTAAITCPEKPSVWTEYRVHIFIGPRGGRWSYNHTARGCVRFTSRDWGRFLKPLTE
jgi:hypothetical protein